MARTDDDTWGITESIGATALGVAMARAAESVCDCPLFTDRYAQFFVDAAVKRGWDSSATASRLPIIKDYAAVRTKWFDEYFIAAGANGIDQAVVLAAGLDARPWRLPWVSGSSVYEIDQPQVLAFKADTLSARGAQPAAKYRAVPVDLRGDWSTALRSCGFDPATPTAWSAEGLLPYLSASDQDRLFERIAELSATGSRIAVEALGPRALDPDYLERGRQYLRGVQDNATPDVDDLLFLEERTDVQKWLTDRGWAVTTIETLNLMQRYDRPPEREIKDLTPRNLFIEGRLHTPRRCYSES